MKGYSKSKDDNAKKIAEQWKKNQKIRGERSEELLNEINYTGELMGLSFAEH